MKVVLIDTGRGRTPANVEAWTEQLGLGSGDELALISWNHPKVALPLVDHLVFGPTLAWDRPEPARPNVTGVRRSRKPRASTAHLSRTDPRRLSSAAAWRLRKVGTLANRRLAPITRRLPAPLRSPLNQLSSTSPLACKVRARMGVRSDGVPTDFSVAVARSFQAGELAAWADVVVPCDVRSRKAAWVLAQRVPSAEYPVDMTTAARLIASRR